MNANRRQALKLPAGPNFKTLCGPECSASVCFCFDPVPEESARKIERIWGI